MTKILKQITGTVAITITSGSVIAINVVDQPMYWDGNSWLPYLSKDKIEIIKK